MANEFLPTTNPKATTMHATITNLGTVPVPLYSTQDKGFAYDLDPGEGYTIHSEAVTVASVGDNPTFREEVEEARQINQRRKEAEHEQEHQ